MKYMILTYASQRDYDAMAGKPTAQSAWSAEDFAAMGAFMAAFNQELAASDELVEILLNFVLRGVEFEHEVRDRHLTSCRNDVEQSALGGDAADVFRLGLSLENEIDADGDQRDDYAGGQAAAENGSRGAQVTFVDSRVKPNASQQGKHKPGPEKQQTNYPT